MASVVVSEEQADLLVETAEYPAEVALENEPVKSNNNNAVKSFDLENSSFCSQFTGYIRQLNHFLIPRSHCCLLHLSRCSHLILSTALFVSVAQNGQLAHQLGSDEFSQLSFSMIVTTVILVLLMGLRRFWDLSFNIRSELPMKKILKDACLFSVSLIGMRFCRKDNHVPCHLQDGLFFFTIPFSILYLTLVKCREKMNNKKIKLIIMLTSFMIAVFLSCVPQFAYRYSCRGVHVPAEIGIAQSEQHSMEYEGPWIVLYVLFIGLLSLSLCGFWFNFQEHENSGRLGMQWTVWFHIFCLPVFACLFWINLFPSIGGAEGISDFLNKFENTWVCHFTNNCAISANLGFYIPIFWLLFIYTSNLLLYRFHANPVIVVGNACLAIPLLDAIYGMFYVGQSGIQFKGNIALSGLVGISTFPIAYVILSFYHSACVPLNLSDSFDVY